MFRTNDGRRFIYSRLMSSASPTTASGSKGDIDLTIEQQDSLFRWQISQENPMLLQELSFFMAGLVEYKTLSPKVYCALKKNGVINPVTGALDTTKITKYFLHQVAVLSQYKQRRLVTLLFFWEEEVMRWRLLEEEEMEIVEAISREGEKEYLVMALKVVQAKKRMEPSARSKDHILPAYS